MSTPPAAATQRRRGWRAALLVAALAAVAGTAGVLAQPRTEGGRLDPGSAAPAGARALAQILEREGVEVERVERVDDAVAALSPGASPGTSSGATLVVVGGDVLPPDRLDQLAATDADLVLVEPDGPVLSALAPALAPAGLEDPVVRPAACPDDDAQAAGSALAGGQLVRADGGQPGTLCFPDPEDPQAASYAVTSADGRTVTVVGQGDLLANANLASAGNAALAVRTLGTSPDLVWLMASPLDSAADTEVTATDLLPPWVPWVAAQVVVVAVLAMVWRARRLGRLVPEPLPVVVRSAETAEGRASLYRAAGSRDRAAAVLRAATLRRLAARLGLPAAATAQDVARATARASGGDPERALRLLLGPPPQDDDALVALADDLDALLPHSDREALRP